MPTAVKRLTGFLLLVAAPLAAQGGGQPLRPTDVIRLLAAGSNPSGVASRIARDCLTFVPSTRDRRNFQALGADTAVMTRIDGCVRRGTRKPAAQATTPAVAPAPIPPPSPTTTAATPAATPAAPAPEPSPDKTGFVDGTGQRGVVGIPAANPLVFEVREANGKAIPRARVTFTADNAQIRAETPTTDTAGHVRVNVVFGHTAGKSVIRAAIGQIFRSATLYPLAAAPSRLELYLGSTVVGDTLRLAPDTSVTVRVVATDEFGNPVALVGLQPLSGDEGVVRIERVAGDTVAGILSLKARGQGNTQLALQGSGIFSNLTVVVGH
jgi:hypothetical protein